MKRERKTYLIQRTTNCQWVMFWLARFCVMLGVVKRLTSLLHLDIGTVFAVFKQPNSWNQSDKNDVSSRKVGQHRWKDIMSIAWADTVTNCDRPQWETLFIGWNWVMRPSSENSYYVAKKDKIGNSAETKQGIRSSGGKKWWFCKWSE